MGICASSYSGSRARDEAMLRSVEDLLSFLRFTRSHAQRLLQYFCIFDTDKSGTITTSEFLMFLDVDPTPFTGRTFAMFDTDDSGEISFREFMLAIGTFCIYDTQSLTRFAFSMYDLNGDETIGVPEMQRLVQEVYGPGYKGNQRARNIVQWIRQGEAGSMGEEVTWPQFARFAKKHPALLFPAFHLQRQMQKRVMGVGFWRRHLKQLQKQGNKEAVDTIAQYLDRDKLRSVLEDARVHTATHSAQHNSPLSGADRYDTGGSHITLTSPSSVHFQGPSPSMTMTPIRLSPGFSPAQSIGGISLSPGGASISPSGRLRHVRRELYDLEGSLGPSARPPKSRQTAPEAPLLRLPPVFNTAGSTEKPATQTPSTGRFAGPPSTRRALLTRETPPL